MSSKINVWCIISENLRTLSDSDENPSIIDHITFHAIPITIAAIITYACNINLNNDARSLLVNFGAIFTALLLSVLMLVYDQESKIRDKGKEDILYQIKIKTLQQLYTNISYSVIISICLISLCFIHQFLEKTIISFGDPVEFSLNISQYIIFPIIITLTINLIFTILMIVKRMHTMLLTEKSD